MTCPFCSVMVCAATLAGTTVIGAPSLSLSASSLQNDAKTVLVHTVTGLAPGETVTIERFVDFNNNGAIDAGEPSIRTFLVTDGIRPTIGGVVNGNVPGDDDASTNGAIRVDLPFPGIDALFSLQPGKFVIRVSGPSGQAIQPFEITARSYPQSISGKLKSSASNAAIPNGIMVVLFNDGPIGSVRTDASGAFAFMAQPGEYTFIPFTEGFQEEMTTITLPPNQSVSHDISMSPATVRVTGKLTDADSGAGLPGVFVAAQSGNGLYSGGFTDLNGAYAFSVNSGSWEIQPLRETLLLLGYIAPETGPQINVVSSPVTQDLTAYKATALIYGRVTNPSNDPIPSLDFKASQNGGLNFKTGARTSATGDYFLGVTGGNWDVETDGATQIGFREESRTLLVTTGTATRADFKLNGVTAHVRGRAVDSSGNGLPGVYVDGSNGDDGTFVQTIADSNGNFDLPLWAGGWYIKIDSDEHRISPSILVTVVDGVDQTVNITTLTPTSQISGSLKDGSNQGIGGVNVYASINVNGIYYNTSVDTDAGGQYQLPAINGTWNVSVDCDDLLAKNYAICPLQQTILVDNSDVTVDFAIPPSNSTAVLSGFVVDGDGVGVAEIEIYAFHTSGSRGDITQSDGAFSIPVIAGRWQLDTGYLPNFVTPSLVFDVTDGNDITNIEYKILLLDAFISGTVTASDGSPVAGAHVYAVMSLGDVGYSIPSVVVDAAGQYNLPVARGEWTVNLDCFGLNKLNYNCPPEAYADTTQGPATLDFVVTRVGSNPTRLASPGFFTGGDPRIYFYVQGDVGIYDILGSPTLPFPSNSAIVATVTVDPLNSLVVFAPGENRFFLAQRRP